MQILNIAGAKARLAPWIIEYLPAHQVYVEPFGGSGAVLLAKPPASLEIFNDLDGGLVSFFETLAHRSQELYERIDGLFYSAHSAASPTNDPVDIAARFFVRNNTRWARAGKNHFRSQARVDGNGRTVATVFRDRQEHLLKAALRLKNVVFECRDGLEVIKKYDSPQALFYCDPPYFGERKAHLYAHEMMDEASHRSLSEVLHQCQGFVLSGYSTELYRELYKDWTVVVRHSLSNGKDLRQECLWIKNHSSELSFRQLAKAQRTKTARERVRQAHSQAAKNPLNGQGIPHGKSRKNKSKWDKRLFAILRQSDGLSYSEIQRAAAPIPSSSLTLWLKTRRATGAIHHDPGTDLWSVIKAPELLHDNGLLCRADRAKLNGISKGIQHQLDRIARLSPDLLTLVCAGKLSINAAYNRCRQKPAPTVLDRLRSIWKKATAEQRSIFLQKIGAQFCDKIDPGAFETHSVSAPEELSKGP